MVVSKAHKKAQKYFQQQTRVQRTAEPLTLPQFRHLKKKFYEFARGHGFYETVEEAIKFNGFFIFQWQREIAENLLRSLFMQIDMDINISILRQVGKTEFVGLSTAFAWNNFYNIFKRPIQICVIAPEKDTASVPFKRIEKYIDKSSYIDGGDTKKYKESVRGDSVELFGIYDEYKGSTIEGRAFDLVIRDEAHKGNDLKFIDEVEPTMGAKIGPMIFIGNGGFKDCLFRQRIREGTRKNEELQHESVLICYTYAEAKPYLESLYAEGLATAGVRIRKVEKAIIQHGIDSDEIRKNYFCEWMTEYSNPINQKHLNRCHFPVKFDEKKTKGVYLGLDIATLHDRTVATIMDKDKQILAWIVVKDVGEHLRPRDQCTILREECDQLGFSEHLIAIGFDATGSGSGGVKEFLEEEFDCDLVEYTFSIKTKHEWYSAAIESVTTGFDVDRIKYDPESKYADLFEKECVDLRQKELKSQKYKSYEAPKLKGHFDDFPASFAIVNDLCSQDNSVYKDLNPYYDRYKVEKAKPKEFAGRYC